ncbi:glycogen/starch/alpha-glucan phosphorylase [Actinoplanes sp. N902-109]|uniref:glycogen/starch/alpha-glucan phosphorylase n=1 Tax=Actinoplanes sp. (strain N902-109) TaxID=649831 RepID=UPI000329640A|nr:glycogen/starch/alpha-glucan phosphorylase [Actinoplanes sp. N902-109]AGL18183.1 glycogen/starch/alpha-glucan phosphorylase [Actinoplanes sp. N902-109]
MAGTSFEHDLLRNLLHQRGAIRESASPQDVYQALAVTVRDRLVERYAATSAAYYEANPRFVYYLSAEYMLGRQLPQNLAYAGVQEEARTALEKLGMDPAELSAWDAEPGLGNGGLGRLAACLLDALAAQQIPAVGYGIRYDLGIFQQAFEDGAQVERPDDWAFFGNPWEFPNPDDQHEVGFYGHVEDGTWVPGEVVLGEPSHMLVPGYGTGTVNILRLWRARAGRASFDLTQFGAGRYGEAVEDIVRSENITKVLYPDDSTELGRELRLKQQYFLVTCSLRDIVRRYRLRNTGWDAFADKVTIQLNDTHPVLAIAELMRVLVDEERLEWHRAWEITRGCFAYTCHTLLPEALETWPVALLERLLPRHLEIIYLINFHFLDEVGRRYPGDVGKLRELSIIQEEPERRVRMAHLAVAGSRAVNGVAELHSTLLRRTTLRAFAELWPERFHNVTNGVSPRRFLLLANPRLTGLISNRLGGDGWLTDLDRLADLADAAEDPAFRDQWRQVKRANRVRLADHAAAVTGVRLDPDAMADVMVKRFHEYKRQLLRVLHVVTLVHRIRRGDTADLVPRSIVFGGKAAPSYYAAKQVVRLANAVAALVNGDPALAPYLRMVFLPDYNVSAAELIIPAADLSEQISLAGKEASGTSNMKLALNGAVTIGTLDGANVEIRDRVGADNFFLFGLDVTQAEAVRAAGYRPRDHYERDPELRAVLNTVATLSDIDLLDHDEYLTLADYRSYVDCQDRVARAWRDPEAWARMSILNAARSGFFSADRTVRDYNREIWQATPVSVDPR